MDLAALPDRLHGCAQAGPVRSRRVDLSPRTTLRSASSRPARVLPQTKTVAPGGTTATAAWTDKYLAVVQEVPLAAALVRTDTYSVSGPAHDTAASG